MISELHAAELDPANPGLCTTDPVARFHEQMRALWSEQFGYFEYTVFADGTNACIHKLAFHWSLITGMSTAGYEGRWCYATRDAALAGLREWEARGGDGEPVGWTRHPVTGRRRVKGDPGTEYIDH